MPCPNPAQAYLRVLPTGKKELKFSNTLGRMFRQGYKMPDDSIAIECGQCMTCRLERSRINALRCAHEARMFEQNCFITLTYSPEHLATNGILTDGGYSLVREDAQLFMKRLRKRFSTRLIRAFGCGEYGDKNGRPHFHFCLFNCEFSDRKFKGFSGDFKYYSSDVLSSLWPYGFSSVCDFSFETAAYVARYCTKKITGKLAEEHYRGRLPEFAIWPTRGGGLGKPWFDKYGKTDVIPTDTCIARYVKCSVPKYYDRLRARFDPEGIIEAKRLRSERAKLKADDNTFARLQDKEKCMNAKIKCLVRRLER